MDRSNTLTNRLARARGATAVLPPAGEQTVPADEVEAVDEGRCASSVISGQQCSRRAAAGNTLCAGHIAMGTTAPTLPRATPR